MQTSDKHQLKILIDTVRNPDLWLLGGPNQSEAEQILKTKFNYSDKKIEALRGA
jgi:hypothetical protein|tara:strand:+ start:125 stop:286 length:162 start_codon:yes stop_codon:yes gene_type:complete